MKYIIFECNAENKPRLRLPVIFPDDFVHKDIAEAVEHVKVQPEGPFSDWWMWPKAISAGFIGNDGTCFGYSESLNLKSLPEDTRICQMNLGTLK